MTYSINYQIFNENYNSKFLLLCDHATNRIPNNISKNNLGLTAKQLNSHIAYDIGAKDLSLELSKNLKCPLIASNFSRLIIDPNRSTEDPTLIMQLYDRNLIPENMNLTTQQIEFRKTDFYYPYHKKISEMVEEKISENVSILLVSIHSFTPKLEKKKRRPWHIGILWDKDQRISHPLIEELEKQKHLIVGRNKPYSGDLKGDTLNRHASSKHIPHVLIEIRNDLLKRAKDRIKWGLLLAGALLKVTQGF